MTDRNRHRGIEASIAGRPATGLSLLVGGVLIDPQIRGSLVSSSILGSRPVGVPNVRAIANLDYANLGIEGLSVDAGVTLITGRAAQSRLNSDGQQLEVKGSATLNVGARYRFHLGNREITVRAQVQNMLDSTSWDVNSSETLTYSAARRFRLLLTGNF